MAGVPSGSLGGKAITAAFWTAVIAASGWFLYDTIAYTLTRKDQPGATFLNRHLWLYAHMAVAIPLLFIGPLQFSTRLRLARPRLHRRLGQIFLTGSILGGLLAAYIGATIQYQGSRVPLTLFGLVWAGFAASAWALARHRNIPLHRKFVMRTYALALAFIWVRLMYLVEDQMFWFIEPGDVRDTTREWLSFVLPLLIVETALSWWPDVKRTLAARQRAATS